MLHDRCDLDVIKWLHENCTERCTSRAMDNVAVCGHLEVVKWLHENRVKGCSWNAMKVFEVIAQRFDFFTRCIFTKCGEFSLNPQIETLLFG